jgi:hypothetical protein
VHNFFRGAKAAASSAIVRAMTRAERAGAGATVVQSKNSNATKTHISSVFPRGGEILGQNCTDEKFFAAASRR